MLTRKMPLDRLVDALELDWGDYHYGVHGYVGCTLDGDTLTLQYERTRMELDVDPDDPDTQYADTEYHLRLTPQATEEPLTAGTIVLSGGNVYVRDRCEAGDHAWFRPDTKWCGPGTDDWRTWSEVVVADPDGRVLVLHAPGVSSD